MAPLTMTGLEHPLPGNRAQRRKARAYNSTLVESETAFRSRIATKSIVWLGAASFEDRCLASLTSLLKAGAHVDSLLFLEYETATNPKSIARERRARNEEVLQSLGVKLGAAAIKPIPIDPYSFQNMQTVGEKI